MSTAVVVGSGPNGLAAAVALAAEGVQVTVLEAAAEIGGGARSSEAIVPGLLHDHCSAIHPMAVGSAFLNSVGLDRYGLQWRWPEIDCAHPLDDGSAGVLRRSVEETATGLGLDGPRWRLAFGGPSTKFDKLSDAIMGPLLRVPKHPLTLARFGAPTMLPASTFAQVFRTRACPRVIRRRCGPYISAAALSDDVGNRDWHHHCRSPATAGRSPPGGSQSITNALAALLADLDGKIETRVRVESACQLPPAGRDDVGSCADSGCEHPRGSLTAAYFSRIPPLPVWARRVQGRLRSGGSTCRGATARPARPEQCISAAITPRSPPPNAISTPGGCQSGRSSSSASSTLPTLAARSANTHPLWTYAHVPHGYSGDATEAIIGQIERFAPGFRERIVGQSVRSTTQMSVYNANYVGGDIVTGAKDIRQLVFGPRTTLSPYRIGIPGMYICSAATPPGPGAHGMCGANAAALALTSFSPKKKSD